MKGFSFTFDIRIIDAERRQKSNTQQPTNEDRESERARDRRNKHTKIKNSSPRYDKPSPGVATFFPFPMLSINSVLYNLNAEKMTTYKGCSKN